MLGIGAAQQNDPNGLAWKQNRDFENLLRRLNGGVDVDTEVPRIDGFAKAQDLDEEHQAFKKRKRDDEDEESRSANEAEESVVASKGEKKKKHKKDKKHKNRKMTGSELVDDKEMVSESVPEPAQSRPVVGRPYVLNFPTDDLG
jgi:Pin2-interacting protein X1